MSIERRQVHLDFHTSECIPDIGIKFDKKEFQEALKKGHVGSITLFSKCHHGWAYHPSKVNEMHPNLDFDLLGAQIEAAHEIGVKTPVYLSAGYDERIAKIHPEWTAKHARGFVDTFERAGYHRLCLNTPYVDILIEQIKEVCTNYDDDGIFLDIVAEKVCYCDNCLKTLTERGLDPLDEENIKMLAKEVYANYTSKVRNAIDSVKPGDRVFHNGGHIRRGRRDLAHMNSHLELESLPTGGWGYDHFPMSVAYAKTLGMDYLGMTGKFHKTWGEFGGFKHPNALRYEVSLNAAFGAGSSIGDQCHPMGKLDSATYSLIGTAYAELEEKEPWLDGSVNIADIAVLSSEAVSNYYGIEGSRDNHSDTGCNRMLLEGKYLYDIVDLESDFSDYKVLILPDDILLDEFIFNKINQYVKNGGKILATGYSGLNKDKNKFMFDFGSEYLGENEYTPDYFRPDFEMEGLWNSAYVMYTKGHKLKLTDGTKLASRENSYFNRTAEHFCSHQHAPNDFKDAGPSVTSGKDGIYISWEIFEEYAVHGSLVLKRIFTHTLDMLLGDNKTITTNLFSCGVMSLQKQEPNNRYIAHLLYAPLHKRGENVEIIEDLLPVFDTTLTLKTDKNIKKVYLAPQMKDVEFKQEDNKVSVVVDKFECHQMVVFEY